MLNFSGFDSENNKYNRGPVYNLERRARVWAALTCLQQVTDQASGLESIREIAANLLGSEQLAIFKVDNQKAALWLYWCTGIDPNKYGYLDVMQEPNLEKVLAGEIIFLGQAENERLLSVDDPVNALVPILFHGEVVAVMVIFRLLPQKAALDAVDHEVCHVLSTSAAGAVQPLPYEVPKNSMETEK